MLHPLSRLIPLVPWKVDSGTVMSPCHRKGNGTHQRLRDGPRVTIFHLQSDFSPMPGYLRKGGGVTSPGKAFGLGLTWSSVVEVKRLWINISERCGGCFIGRRCGCSPGCLCAWAEGALNADGERKARMFKYTECIAPKSSCNRFSRQAFSPTVDSGGNDAFGV